MVCACLPDRGPTRVCICHAGCSDCPSRLFLTECQAVGAPRCLRTVPAQAKTRHRSTEGLGGELVLTASRQPRVHIGGRLLGLHGRLRGRCRLGLMCSGLDRPSPACNCTGPGDYRSDLRAWPRPTGRLADGARWRAHHRAMVANRLGAVTAGCQGRDSSTREATAVLKIPDKHHNCTLEHRTGLRCGCVPPANQPASKSLPVSCVLRSVSSVAAFHVYPPYSLMGSG